MSYTFGYILICITFLVLLPIFIDNNINKNNLIKNCAYSNCNIQEINKFCQNYNSNYNDIINCKYKLKELNK